MIKNFIISAYRNLIRNRVQSAIQISSLAIGITAFILIGLYAQFEMSYDHFNEKLDRIYRLEYGTGVGMPSAVGHRIKTQVSEVENVVRIINWHGKDNQIPIELNNDRGDQEQIWVEDWYYCDSSIFEVFTFEFILGNPDHLLRDQQTAVISETTARRIFGNRNPMGQLLGDDVIQGVFKDLQNSHIEMNLLRSMISMNTNQNQKGSPDYLNNFAYDLSFMTYILLRQEADPERVTLEINQLLNERTQESNGILTDEKEFHLRPLKEVYFTTESTNEKNYSRHGNRRLVFVLMTVAVFILALAVINYMNLTTARVSLRAREAGMRKILGSSRRMLSLQFLVEAVLVSLFSLFIGLTIIQLLLPGFNRLVDSGGDLQLLFHPGASVLYLVLGVGLGILSGIYPALLLTRQTASSVQSETTKGGRGQVFFRRLLLTFQFAVSVILIVGIMVILKQLRFMKTADLGFDRELVINFQHQSFGEDRNKRILLKEKLTEYPDILGVGFSSSVQGEEMAITPQSMLINGIRKPLSYIIVNPDFFEVMGIDVLRGRNFSWDRSADFAPGGANQLTKVILNETAVKEFELENPIGLSQINEEGNGGYEIIGVVRDINFVSQHKMIEPTAYLWWPYMSIASVKITSHDIPATIRFIKEQVETLIPDIVFQYSFLDETYERQYRRDEKTAVIISIFALIAVLIACLGLFGLSSFMAVRRTKEIGIRKALGASESSVYLLLVREFYKWVILAMVIATPISWFIMNRWLNGFAYRTGISWWIYGLAILTSVLITLTTVTWQSLKTARTNPVDSLRYE